MPKAISRSGRRVQVTDDLGTLSYPRGSDGSSVINGVPLITSERSEPSSRIFLIGEQPNPWDLLQPQDKMSRHRGAEHYRRYGLLGSTSLLSLE